MAKYAPGLSIVGWALPRMVASLVPASLDVKSTPIPSALNLRDIIAHRPRQPVDNEPQNQCRSFRDGRVHHFVGLDPEGNLIQAK